MAFVSVAEFPESIGANLVLSLLEAAGIDAVLFDGGMTSLGLGGMTPARLMVDETDLDEARTILSDY